MNGKPSSMDWPQLKALLESTPAAQVEKVELMTAAPARYHIRGPVLDVRLRSGVGRKRTVSGEVFGSYAQSREGAWTGRGNLLYGSERLSVDALYSYRFSRSRMSIDKRAVHTLRPSGEQRDMNLFTGGKGFGGNHTFRLGADYEPATGHRLSAVYTTTFRYGGDGKTMHGTAESDTYLTGHRYLHNARMDYTAPFGLAAGFDFLYFDSPSDSWLAAADKHLAERSNQRINRRKLYVRQTHERKDGPSWNYGVNYTTTCDHSYQFYADAATGEALPESSLQAHREEYTLNLYAGASHSLGETLSGEVSLAAELYHGQGRHSWRLYPTVNLDWQPADGHTVQASFTSNREYPDFWQTQPAVYYVDSYSEVHGNPALKPYSSYDFSLTYLYKNTYMWGVGYTAEPESFTQLPYQCTDAWREINRFVNFNYQRQFTVQAMSPFRVGRWWQGRAFALALFSHDRLDDFYGLSFNRRKLTGIFHLNNTFTLSPQWTATLSARYQTAAIQGFYDIRGMGDVSASLAWQARGGRWRVTLKGDDLLNQGRPETEIDWQGQRMWRRIDWDRRAVTLSVSCKLGGYREKQRSEVDMQRIGR